MPSQPIHCFTCVALSEPGLKWIHDTRFTFDDFCRSFIEGSDHESYESFLASSDLGQKGDHTVDRDGQHIQAFAQLSQGWHLAWAITFATGKAWQYGDNFLYLDWDRCEQAGFA